MKGKLLNYTNIEFNPTPDDTESDSVINEEDLKIQRHESGEDLERGKVADRNLVFFADDFYIFHQAMSLQVETLNRQDIKLEMFINGKEMNDRLKAVLDKIKPNEIE